MIPSPNHESRAGTVVDLLAVHTAEGARRAADLGRYFQNPDVEASSHDGADNGETIRYVDYERAAWTLLNGNRRSENLELCGFAHWSRDDWFANVGILNECAAWLAQRSVARNIPLRKLSPAEVDAGMSGVIGHADWTYSVIGWGNHTDPGPSFPWDYVLDRARALVAGGELPGVPSAGPAPQPADAWPLPSGHFFGDVTGPDWEHGGVNPQERVWVTQIQRALIQAGAVPGVTDPASGWADGVWEQPTTDAVERWQRSAGYQVTGDVHQVDWDLLVHGRASLPAGTPQNPAPSAPRAVPAWPLPSDHWFGDWRGPEQQHGGYYESERPWVQMIQRALQQLGCTGDQRPEWADGRWDQPTTDAMVEFQRRFRPNSTTLWGQCWSDDWADLLGRVSL